MHQLNLVFQIATATLLGLVCVLLAKHSRSGLNTWTGIGFTISIFCYVIIESAAVQSIPAVRTIASIGAICIPVQFWLLARAIFDDHFQFSSTLIVWFLVQLIPLDPGNGNVYASSIWLIDSDTLKVRGYLGPFYRSQVWKRMN